MIRKALRTGLKSTNVNTRYFVYGQSGRAIMGNPEPNSVPRDIFQYHYAFDNYPEMLGGYQYKSHNKYVLEQSFAFEVFEFKYAGQQWDIGSWGVNFLYFAFPFIIWLIRKKENESAEAVRAARGAHYITQGGVLADAGVYWEDGTY